MQHTATHRARDFAEREGAGHAGKQVVVIVIDAIIVDTPDEITHFQHLCVLQCVAVCCSVLQCVAVCCSVLQYVAVCCSVLQCVAVCCNVLFLILMRDSIY